MTLDDTHVSGDVNNACSIIVGVLQATASHPPPHVRKRARSGTLGGWGGDYLGAQADVTGGVRR